MSFSSVRGFMLGWIDGTWQDGYHRSSHRSSKSTFGANKFFISSSWAKKILGLTQRQRCFFRNITLQCIFSKYLLSNNRKRVNVIWLSCALSGWDINVCLIDQLLRCNVGQCHVWQKGGMPISAICTCVSIIGPRLHQFPLCISFVPDADVGQCQLHLWWKCQAGL